MIFSSILAIMLSLGVIVNLEKTAHSPSHEGLWAIDFFDDFHDLNPENWQDQLVWVNDEVHCYVESGKYNTLTINEGILELRVIELDSAMYCNNFDKHGNLHPPTAYVSSRICTKNRKEFVKGRWTARLRLHTSGEPSQFPAWWILGAHNDERPVQEAHETICWPKTGSGEIDIFEHHGDYMKNAYTTGRIVNLNECDKGDWWSKRTNIESPLESFHEYSVEWQGSDLIYRLDGKEVYRNVGDGDLYPEPMFAILNYAKITDHEMSGEWLMEVDWVKHEFRK